MLKTILSFFLWALARIKEPSTLAAASGLSAGLTLMQQGQVAEGAVSAVMGVLGTIVSERGGNEPPTHGVR